MLRCPRAHETPTHVSIWKNSGSTVYRFFFVFKRYYRCRSTIRGYAYPIPMLMRVIDAALWHLSMNAKLDREHGRYRTCHTNRLFAYLLAYVTSKVPNENGAQRLRCRAVQRVQCG